jgi:tetratricopeptide (TPR) repeat protein
MKPGRIKQFPAGHPAAIPLRGKKYTVTEASALAIQEFNLGHLQAALGIYNLILARFPDYAEACNNRGAILQKMNRYEEALASYDRAIVLKPDYANVHHNRGSTLKKLNRYEEALASFDRAIALQPDHAEAYHNRGVILQEMKRYDEALASYDRTLALKPDHAEACNNRGLILANRGDMAAAEKMFLQAAALKPDFSEPLFNLAIIRKYRSADSAEVKNIRMLLDKPGISSEDKESLYFSLGKIYDDCGLYDEAFECFRLANQLRNASVAYDAGAVTRLTNAIIEVFSPDFLAQPFAFASDNRSPLFIVGMPRSGTTLLASILSNHRSIATAGEVPAILDFTARLPELTGTGIPYPQSAKQLTPAVAGRLIHDYEQRLRRDVGSEVPQVIDKNMLNFRHLGFISMLFPQARIIHCTRDPLDTGLSNYFQRFPKYLDYSFDLRNIGHFYGEYARLMAHWRKISALKMMEISYEDMIQNTEPVVRRMLHFLGLSWDERCLAPHTNPASVETASQWQVRQPIYQQSVGRWRHYEKHLAPLMEILRRSGQLPG